MTEQELIDLINRNGGFPDNNLTELPNSTYRKVLERLAPIQENISDKLVRAGGKLGQPLDILPFIPYFLTGGHDTSNAMERIAREGLDRPNRAGQRSGKVRGALDALAASQLSTYYTPMAIASKLATRGSKGVLNKLIGVEGMNNSRRDFIKGSAALAGAGALSAVTPKAMKSIGKLFDEPLLGKSVVDEVASVAPSVMKNSMSFADKIATLREFSNNNLLNIPDELLMAIRNESDNITKIADDLDVGDYYNADIKNLLSKTPEQWEQLSKAQEIIKNTSAKDAMLKTHGEEKYAEYLTQFEDPAKLDKILTDTPMSDVYKEFDNEYGWTHGVQPRKDIEEGIRARQFGEKPYDNWYIEQTEKHNLLDDIIWGDGDVEHHWLLKDYPEMQDVIWAESNS